MQQNKGSSETHVITVVDIIAAVIIAASIAITYQILEINQVMGEQRPVRLSREYPATRQNEKKLQKYIDKDKCPKEKSTQ
jgi:hypothetical protein